jgi:hypothetical protein
MGRLAIAAFAMILGGDAAGCRSQPGEDRWFSTETAADREFMGAILLLDGCFTYTVSAGRRGVDRIVARVRVPRGAEIVAFWHTHGNEARRNRYFSSVDTRLVQEWKVPFYLADYTGTLKVLRPGAPLLTAFEARLAGLPPRPGMAAGSVVRSARGMPVEVALDD